MNRPVRTRMRGGAEGWSSLSRMVRGFRSPRGERSGGVEKEPVDEDVLIAQDHWHHGLPFERQLGQRMQLREQLKAQQVRLVDDEYLLLLFSGYGGERRTDDAHEPGGGTRDLRRAELQAQRAQKIASPSRKSRPA